MIADTFYCTYTGSAHCALCVYWTNKLNLHGQQLTMYQASARGGILLCQWNQNDNTVSLQGNAVTVIQGNLLV